MKRITLLLVSLFIILMVNQVFSKGLNFEKINWKGKEVEASSDFINVKLKDNYSERKLINVLTGIGLSIDTVPDVQNYARIKIERKTKSLIDFIIELEKSGMFEFVEPDFIIRASVTPNDTYYSNQYALPKVNAPDAWYITKGDDDLIIGVLDSGIPISSGNLSHSDLQNTTRIIEGVDYVGDGNGVKDERGHGTHVAGIVGAETNNNTGVAGINWKSKLRINQVFDKYGTGYASYFRSALINAVDNGCKIINFSGGSMIDSWYMENAVQYAQNNNALLIAAAGNYDPENNPNKIVEYPAAYSVDYNNVIAVSSTNSSDVLASSSSRGLEVVVSSPGDHIYSTLPNYEVYFNTHYGLNKNYDYVSGTSMAAPLVAGLSGLMLSINPDLPPNQTREIMENTAVDLGDTGFDNLYGHGRIDAFEALRNTPTWNNVIKNDMYGYDGGNIKFEYTGYNSPYTIPEYFWQEIVAAERTQTHDGIDYLFSHWDDGEKNYSRDLTLTNNGEYTAVYTGHLHSQSNTAVATGGGRKVWTKSYWNPDLGGPGYRVVYEDNGEIYYTEYYLCTVIPGNPFYMWTDERLISDGSGNSKYPSLAVSERGECCIVWQQFVPSTGKYQILYRVLYYDEAVVITNQSTSNISRPVVGVSSGCRGMGLYYSCYFHFIWDNGNGLKFYSTNNYDIIDIPNTNSSSHNPTITNDQHFYIDKIAYAWEQNGDIYFQQIGFDDSPQDCPVENITSSYSDLRDCHAPSIALSSANGNIMLSWYGEYPYMPCIESIIDAIGPKPQKWFDHVFAIKKESYGNWGYLKRFLHDGYLTYTPSVGSAGYNFSLIWKVINQNLLGKIDYIEEQGWDSSSDLEEFLVPGIKHPSISSGSSNAISAVWSKNSSSPYSIHHQVFNNPSQAPMAKSGSNNLKNVQNKIYRSAAINLKKLNSSLKGMITVNISHPRLNSQYISFSPDSLSQLSSIFHITDDFIINSDVNEIEFDFTIFVNNIEVPAFLDDFEIFCLELNTKENSPLSSNILIESIYLSDLITGEDQNIYMKKTIKFGVPYSDKKSYQVNGSFFSSIGNLIKPEICDHFYLKSKYIMDNEQNDNKSNTEELVTKFILHGASPNPFNPTTKISFNLPLPSHVKLSVYNIRGQFIKTLLNEFKDEGSHSVTFDGSNLASGIYFYILDAGKFTDVKRILLIK